MSTAEILNSAILILTIIAIIYGPIKAVKITRKMDFEHEVLKRKLDILRVLMKTRQIKLSFEHVGALNLIELEFYEIEQVISPYRAYRNHLGSPVPPVDGRDSYYTERDSLFLTLLQALSNSLGYNFDKHDLMKFGYSPMGWEEDGSLQRANQRLLKEILEGKRSLPISAMQQDTKSMFPPPPTISNE